MAFETRGTEPLVVTTTFTILATLLGVLRYYVRKRIVKSVGIEDWLILVAIIFSIAETVMVWQQVKYGLGRHVTELTLHEIVMGLKYLWFSIILYITSLTIIKLSILVQYQRLFVGRNTRVATWALMGIVIVYGIWALLSGIFSCFPVAKYWDASIKGHCMPVKVLWYSNGSINVATDFSILLLPMPSLWALTMERRKKILVTIIFGLGGFVCIVSLLRIWAINTALKTTDPTWDLTNAAIFSNVEMNVAIFCASIPMLRQFFGHILSNLRSNVRHINSSSDDPLTKAPTNVLRKQPMVNINSIEKDEIDVESLSGFKDRRNRNDPMDGNEIETFETSSQRRLQSLD